ncbi:conserved Plasmodium protein, unknown function [Plasmodium ovale]|uniref:Uncharacterized protein n=1 Tax=Plasmodium ovale TaxID=36330 RepID=A0A1C3KVZ1_PLAOA|nr:conserved Plasmodium protein, unknown function [Plasmodium ovale]
MKEGVEKRNYERGKIYIFYDEIYDTYRKEKKGRNYYDKILRFPNPSVLIIKALSELYNVTDKIEYVSCKSSFQMVKTHSYFNGEKKGIYETLHIVHSMRDRSKIETEDGDKEGGPMGNTRNVGNTGSTGDTRNMGDTRNVHNSHNSHNSLNTGKDDTDMLKAKALVDTAFTTDLLLFHILNEFQDVHEYFLFLCQECYKNYTRKFFINSNYNIVKGYFKLQDMKNYVSAKYRSVSFDSILSRFIKLLHLCMQIEKNWQNIECVVFYIYFYTFLNIPSYIFPWSDRSNNDRLNRKILKDGNVNMIISEVISNKNNFFSHILNSTIDTHGYYETYDFNMAIWTKDLQKKREILLNSDCENDPNDTCYNFFFEKKEEYINLNEYILFKNIGYNSLKQFYKPHFYYLTVLKKIFVFNVKMHIMKSFFRDIAIRIIGMDKNYKNCVKRV